VQWLSGITNFLLQLGQALIGQFAVAFMTAVLAMMFISCLLHWTPWSYVWRTVIGCLVLVSIGSLAQQIASFGGG